MEAIASDIETLEAFKREYDKVRGETDENAMPKRESTDSQRETTTATAVQQGGDQDWTPDLDDLKVDAQRAAAGGVLAALVTLGAAWLVGSASGAGPHDLLKTSLSSTRSFAGTVTLALGNILALMLTFLGLSAGVDVDLKWSHYQRVKQIAWLNTVALIGAVLIYLMLNVPLAESEAGTADTNPTTWFSALYYATLVLSSLLGGALISIALMLFNTVRDIIHVIGQERESELVEAQDGAG
jgi:hypothetical protein